MPSAEHNELAVMAFRWLQNKVTGRGLRGGFEVPVEDGYVADAVALCAFQQRFAEKYHPEAIQRERFVMTVPELAVIIEAKATRSDFLATFGDGERHENRKSPAGNMHWCVVARGVARPDELPEFWGLLTPRGAGLTELRQPTFTELVGHESMLQAMAYQILWYAKENNGRWASSVYSNNNY